MNLLDSIVDAIHRFIGGRRSLEELGISLDASAAVASEKLDWRNSIVDLLKLTNQDSSLDARSALAKQLGYPGPFDGSADMNTWLHQKVMDRLR